MFKLFLLVALSVMVTLFVRTLFALIVPIRVILWRYSYSFWELVLSVLCVRHCELVLLLVFWNKTDAS